MKILIDPGHGGKDPGAIGHDGTREADITMAIGTHMQAIFNGLDDVPALTRWKNQTVSLDERCQIEHAVTPDCFISLHCNAFRTPGPSGIEVWTSPGQTKADPLATSVYKSIQAIFPSMLFRSDMSDGDPDKEGRLYVLQHTRCPAILVETGFISNVQDCEWLKQPVTQKLLALTVSAGVLKWIANV